VQPVQQGQELVGHRGRHGDAQRLGEGPPGQPGDDRPGLGGDGGGEVIDSVEAPA
jgi:hypothetical protein